MNDSPGRDSIPAMITQNPKELFQKSFGAQLNEANIPRNAGRNTIPIEILIQADTSEFMLITDVSIQVFERLQSEAPSELLQNEIWGISSNAADFWKKTQQFARSAASGSVLCYLLGIGDRHLDNMLLDMKNAEVVNIDFNLCFGSGEKLRVPEIVPFRLTPVIQVCRLFQRTM